MAISSLKSAAFFAIVFASLVTLPASADGANASYIAPVNSSFFKLTEPDGSIRWFVRDEDDDCGLRGVDEEGRETPWSGELRGRQTLVMSDPEEGGDGRGFLFADGFLRLRRENGADVQVSPPDYGACGCTIASLWPAPGERLKRAVEPDIWADSGRLRLWYRNPNKAGILFAELAILALAFVLTRRLCTLVPALSLFAASFIGMVLSGSRGAFLAFLAGIAAIVVTRAKQLFTWRRLGIAFAALAVLAGAIFAAGYADRFTKNLFKEGGAKETSRLLVWREVPRMIADAPGGWGFGNSARAYIDWYQKDSNCIVHDLISGHFTFLAESGWALSFVYIFLWLASLFAAFRSSLRGDSPVPLALLSAFAVGAVFNPIVYEPALVALPVLAALFALFRGFRGKESRRCLTLVLIGSVAAVILATVCFFGASRKADVEVARRGNAVVLNASKPVLFIAEDDFVLHGGFWWQSGNAVRSYFAKHPEVAGAAFVRSVADLPRKAEKLVLIGETGRDYLALPEAERPSAKRLVFISPPFSWKDVPRGLLESCEVKLVVGAVAARMSDDYRDKPDWVLLVRGAELYIPGWQRFLVP